MKMTYKYKGIDKNKILEVQKVKLSNVDAHYIPTEERFIDLIKANEIDPIRDTIERHYKQVSNNTELYIICEMALMYLDSLEKKVADDKKAYNEGLEKAWDLAQKIVGPTNVDGYTHEELNAIFRTLHCSGIVYSNSVYEVLEKVEAYEKEKAEIHVGDVVKHAYRGLVVVTGIENEYCHVLTSDCTSLTLLKSSLVKTDKHVDIQPTLDLLKNSLKGDK